MKTQTLITGTNEYQKTFEGRTFVELQDGQIYLLATPIMPGRFFEAHAYHVCKRSCEMREDDLKNYEYFKNHLAKFIKKQIV